MTNRLPTDSDAKSRNDESTCMPEHVSLDSGSIMHASLYRARVHEIRDVKQHLTAAIVASYCTTVLQTSRIELGLRDSPSIRACSSGRRQGTTWSRSSRSTFERQTQNPPARIQRSGRAFLCLMAATPSLTTSSPPPWTSATQTVRLSPGHVPGPGGDSPRVAAVAHAADVAHQRDFGDRGRGRDSGHCRRRQSSLSTVLGTLAVIAATTNIVGGFWITDRMLKMFRRETSQP